MQSNTRTPSLRTYEGAPAKRITPEQQLRRSVMSCLLWEREFYEDGLNIADRIDRLVQVVDPTVVASTAIEARKAMKLRHVPLWILRCLFDSNRADTTASLALQTVIDRADEPAEFLSMWFKDGKRYVPNQMRRAIGNALYKFNEYQLAKYDRPKAVRLRDVIRLCHPIGTKQQHELWGRVLRGDLATPDTWETQLSAGADKKETFTRLLTKNKLGDLALLRNLRNMEEAKVDRKLIGQAILDMKAKRVLPFRFIAAEKAAPLFAEPLEDRLLASARAMTWLPGLTAICIDCSGSMDNRLSNKSTLTRFDAATALAIIAREMCDSVSVIGFGTTAQSVPVRHGFAIRDTLQYHRSAIGWHTNIGLAVRVASEAPLDRIIVITDEQSHDRLADPPCKHAYFINTASAQNGIGYGPWTHIDGFSEGTLAYLTEVEA